jgi:DNA-binding IclR family transcriptional regulator
MRRDPYLVRAVVHSAIVLSAFDTGGQALNLSAIAARARLSKTMTFRQLYTLERCGLVERVTATMYRLGRQQPRRRVDAAELMELVR